MIVVCSFLLTLLLAAAVVTYVGVFDQRPPNLALVQTVRFTLASLTIAALVLAIRGRVRPAATLLLTSVFVSFLASAGLSVVPSAVAYLGATASAILAVQVATLLVSSVRMRLLYGGAVWIGLMAAAFTYFPLVPEDEKVLMGTTAVVSFFMFAMVFVPALAGAHERNRLVGVLRGVAYVDSVTALPNASQLSMDLEEELQRVHSSEAQYAAFGLSIAGFGRINRRHGYLAGDRALRQVAERLKRLKSRYRVYRIPGAMFVFLPRFTWTFNESAAVFSDFDEALKHPVSIGETSVTLNGIVVGTVAPLDGRSARRIVHNLQNAVAREHQQHTDARIQWFDVKQYRQMERQFTIEEAVREAVGNDGFHVHIQPKQDLITGQLHGGEILARWSQETLGHVSPVEFIPAIENQGLMVPFTRNILRRGHEALSSVPKSQQDRIVVAVNLTASSLCDPQTIEVVQQMVTIYEPAILEVELTEDVFLMMDFDIAASLERMKALGVRLALDDFGTGFSNLSYLQDLHVDTLKIDRRFIDPLPDDKGSLNIVRAVCNMASSFGIETVAEGVETEEQRQLLRDIGCDIVQGYLYAKPLAPTDFAAFCRGES
jgi:diguanylate cyclase (GGDEF)-like protein